MSAGKPVISIERIIKLGELIFITDNRACTINTCTFLAFSAEQSLNILIPIHTIYVQKSKPACKESHSRQNVSTRTGTTPIHQHLHLNRRTRRIPLNLPFAICEQKLSNTFVKKEQENTI